MRPASQILTSATCAAKGIQEIPAERMSPIHRDVPERYAQEASAAKANVIIRHDQQRAATEPCDRVKFLAPLDNIELEERLANSAGTGLTPVSVNNEGTSA